jgi:hypothetical protein
LGGCVSITIEVSLPARVLNPNVPKKHWGALARAKKKARAAAGFAAIEASGNSRPMWAAATVEATFHLRDSRGLNADQDNRIASLKATMDGIADAGVILNDRGLTWKPIQHAVDRKRPRVVIVITPTQGSQT